MHLSLSMVSGLFRKLPAIVLIGIVVMVAGCGGVEQRGPHQYNVAMVSNMILPMGIPNVDIKKSDLQLTWTLLEAVDASRDVLVEVKIDSLKASMDSLTIQCLYDSTLADEGLSENDQEASRVKNFMGVMRGIAGCRYTARVNLDTHVVKIIDMDKRLKAIGQGGNSDNGMFGHDQIKICLKGPILDAYARLGVYGLSDTVSSKEPFTLPSGVTMPNTAQYTLVKTHKDSVVESVHRVKDDPATPQFDVVKYSIELGDAQLIKNGGGKGKKGAKRDRQNAAIKIKEISGEGELSVDKNGKYLVHSLENIRSLIGNKATRGKKKKGKKAKMWYILRCEISHVN